ncbi:collagen-like protein [Anaerobiospirillum sp. NML120448]|uniref:collagen-like protein n=1 Tax=Anaerobiospirillum sp. NML120448 TaxID=2932816 RepID=UPI001FF45B8C|nr:collagen-like protein [Anaerobiospirillum sp. NML120448]MCK0514109.1 collagen-like protein [Anaerobiospirillum sp. NML120448]
MEAKTEEYLVHKWTKGEVINEANLNNIEQGLKKSTDAIRSLETAAIEVETLEAGEQATAQYDAASNTWYFAVPKGDQGKQGLQGAQGEQGAKGDTGERGLQGAQGPAGVAGPKGDKGDTGAAGAAGAAGPAGPAGARGEQGQKGEKGDAGARGNCFRVANAAVTASAATNPIANLTPSNSDIPVAVNDLVIDNTKKIYKITAVSGSNFTASALIATLP